jgi:hypothetical protein
MPTTLDAPATAAPAANGNAVMHKGKRQAKAAQDSGPPPAATFQASNEAFNSAIAVNMCGVDVVVRRPSGAVKIPGVKVMAITESGASEEVKKTTTPGFIIDEKGDHPLWGAIDDNQREIEAVLEKYSINDARRGFHLVPMSKTGNLLAELRARRQERLELVSQLKCPEAWNALLANLRQKYPDHFHLLMPRMPNPDLLLEKFDVTWSLNPLTPINPAHLRFDELNAVDKQAIIDESNRMAQDLVKTRAQAIYDLIFGEFLQKCDDIVQGSFESGNRKFSDIEVLIFQLERLKNFSEFGTPAMAQHAENTLEVLRQVDGREDIGKFNHNKGKNQITAALKAAIKPLHEEIQAMYEATTPGSGRARRSLE